MAKCKPKTDWYYGDDKSSVILKTTTQEMLEAGMKKISKPKIVLRKLLNFQSYPMNDFRFNLMTANRPKLMAATTSYSRDYAPPNDWKMDPPKIIADNDIDPLLNRKPPNDFGMRQTSKFKFMDDQFVNLSESRKRINFMRQLRNAHHEFV